MEALFELVLFGLFMQACTEEECYCGFTEDSDAEIINGNEVTNNYKYPWIVGLKRGDQLCGGALISPTFVLTAAHCNKEEDPEGYEVIFIESGKRKMTYQVKKVINNPYFDASSETWSEFDIAIVEMDGSIECKQFSIPICIPEEDFGEEGLEVTTVGFGLTKDPDEEKDEGDGDSEEESSESNADDWQLNEGTAQIADDEYCAEGQQKDFERYLVYCVQGTNNSTTCEGDSGSSMFIERDGVYYTLGIVSASVKDGCDLDAYKFFPNVFQNRNFIKNNVKDLAKPKPGQESTADETSGSEDGGPRFTKLLTKLIERFRKGIQLNNSNSAQILQEVKHLLEADEK